MAASKIFFLRRNSTDLVTKGTVHQNGGLRQIIYGNKQTNKPLEKGRGYCVWAHCLLGLSGPHPCLRPNVPALQQHQTLLSSLDTSPSGLGFAGTGVGITASVAGGTERNHNFFFWAKQYSFALEVYPAADYTPSRGLMGEGAWEQRRFNSKQKIKRKDIMEMALLID